jgi:WD40 repeat protein
LSFFKCAILAQNYFKPYANNKGLGELFINDHEIRIVIFVRKSSKVIVIYNLLTGKLIHQLAEHTKRFTCASLYDQNKLVSGSKDGSIKFWDLQTGKCLKTLYVDRIYCLKVLKNGNFATGSGRNSIIIWDMVMYNMKFILFSNDPNKITCLDQLSNEWLVSGGFDNDAIEIWDLNKQVCIRGIHSSLSKKTFSKSYSSDYRAGRVTFLKAFEKTIDGIIECFFATGTGVRQEREVICIWNASNGTCVKELLSDRDRELPSISLYSLELISHDQLLCSYDLYFYYRQFFSGHAQLLLLKKRLLKKHLWERKHFTLGMVMRYPNKYGHEISEQLSKVGKLSGYWEEFYTNFKTDFKKRVRKFLETITNSNFPTD